MGTLLHVAAWVVALIYDIMVGLDIDHDQSPGAWTYWLWGTITLGIGLVGVLGVTGFHFWSWYWKTSTFTIPEGAAAPWMMTLFIGGAQISLILTILQMIASTGSPGSDFFNYPNDTVTVKEQKDYRESQRQLMVISMVMKVYIVQFLKNNQECTLCLPVNCPCTFTSNRDSSTDTSFVLFSQGPVLRMRSSRASERQGGQAARRGRTRVRRASMRI